jgi:hypothetical protein
MSYKVSPELIFAGDSLASRTREPSAPAWGGDAIALFKAMRSRATAKREILIRINNLLNIL